MSSTHTQPPHCHTVLRILGILVRVITEYFFQFSTQPPFRRYLASFLVVDPSVGGVGHPHPHLPRCIDASTRHPLHSISPPLSLPVYVEADHGFAALGAEEVVGAGAVVGEEAVVAIVGLVACGPGGGEEQAREG